MNEETLFKKTMGVYEKRHHDCERAARDFLAEINAYPLHESVNLQQRHELVRQALSKWLRFGSLAVEGRSLSQMEKMVIRRILAIIMNGEK